MSRLLGLEHHDRELRVTIERPEKRKALNRGPPAALREAFEARAGDESLRVAVLTGAGDGAFATIAGAHRRSAREGIDALEADRFVDAWVHDDHWFAAERMLAGGR